MLTFENYKLFSDIDIVFVLFKVILYGRIVEKFRKVFSMGIAIGIERKIEILSEYHDGNNVRKFCREHGIGASTFYRWRNELRDDAGCRKPLSLKIYKMEVELERLRIDNEIFRKSGCPVNSPLHNRLEAISSLQNQYNVHALCRVFNVNRSTFYYHQKRKTEISILECEDNEYKPLIEAIFEKSKERFGARKIRFILQQQGYTISTKRIYRLMSEMGLVCKQSRLKYWSTTNRIYRYYGNKIRNNFRTEKPNKTWVSDITYIRINDDFHYICVIVDLFSRKVIAYSISATMALDFVLETFDKSFKIRGCPRDLLFHSDQGFQYTSFAFRSYLRECGVKQSFSRPGMPRDNAVVESFFAIMKREELSHNLYDSVEQLDRDVADFITFFNEMRPHRTLNYQTPQAIEDDYFNNL